MFDIFIKRPVLASVVSLLILVIGLRALTLLPVRQYPEMKNTVITITTTFPGADSELMQGFITQPIQKAVSTASGIDYMTSRSAQGVSEVKVFVRLNEDPNKAMTEVMAKVAETRSVLPRGINDSVIKKETGQTFASAYLAFSSDRLSQEQITDYVTRVVQPKLSAVPGIANPEVFGAQRFSIRLWLDPQKLALYNVSAENVRSAIETNNYTAAAGQTKGSFDIVNTQAQTDLKSVEQFKRLVVRHDGAQLVRMSDVANVKMGAESDDVAVFASGDAAIFVGIYTTPEANPLTVIKEVREKTLPEIITQLPPGLTAKIAYDSTVFIQAAIDEVVKTILEAAVIVMVVIFLFMGSLRSVIIPVITVPLSLVGVTLFMLMAGASINLLTLLAMVLAIGLVVDDAIVVVENVHRHIEEGLKPFEAALVGTREIAGPVISMTITLAAVYAPIFFMGGLTGALFKEFALALAGAVIVSGVIALTLSPMMSAFILKAEPEKRGLSALIDRIFNRVQHRYARMLQGSLNGRATTLTFAFIVMASLFFLFRGVPGELAPEEDQGVIFAIFNGPASANSDYMKTFSREVDRVLRSFKEVEGSFLVSGFGSVSQGFGGAVTKPWSERTTTTKQLTPQIQGALESISGVKGFALVPPALPGSDGAPIQFVINSPADYSALAEIEVDILQRAMATGRFIFLDFDLKYESPQTIVEIDRDKAGAYGVTMQQIGTVLATMTGGNYVNLVNLQGRSYQVIPQVPREFRLDPSKLGQFYVKAADGTSVPLSNIVSLRQTVQPGSLNQFNQLNSVTITGVPMPGISLGQGLDTLRQVAEEVLPQGYTYDYAGQSRQYIQEGSQLVLTFFFALVIIFLVLAAQFESFRDPLVILVSVPLSLCGALLPLAMGAATMNIYTQVGLITLIGLITKHGILICEVAKEQQKLGLSRREAVEVAASMRLRPILMTTAAMVAGLIPLLSATGAGAASRFSIAVVIVAGMSIGTLFTLFVLPVIYTILAGHHKADAPEHGPEPRHTAKEAVGVAE
jgi:multidrug efflux pump